MIFCVKNYCIKKYEIKQTKQTKMTDCSICMDVMCNEHVTHTKCKHVFHTNCLKKWTDLNTNCPLCRTQLVSEPVPEPVINPNNWFMNPRAYFQHRGF